MDPGGQQLSSGHAREDGASEQQQHPLRVGAPAPDEDLYGEAAGKGHAGGSLPELFFCLFQELQAEVEDLTSKWEADTLKECDEGYVEPIDSDEEPVVAEE